MCGLNFLAITDHFYQDGTPLNRKNEVNRIRYLEGAINGFDEDFYIISSAEFNIGQKINCWNRLKNLKWRPIGLHSWFVERETMTLTNLFDLFEEASARHNAFVHIEREIHELDNKKHGANLDDEVKNFFKLMVALAKEKDIWLEVNESSLVRHCGGDVERLKYWIRLAKENRNKIYLGTDAHFAGRVGNFNLSLQLLNEVEYPRDLILNCDYEQLAALRNI